MGDATLSVVTLVAANALPVLGVLALGWSVFPIVLLYWLENAVVGVFTVLKMLLAGPDDTPQLTSQSTSKAFLIPHHRARGVRVHAVRGAGRVQGLVPHAWSRVRGDPGDRRRLRGGGAVRESRRVVLQELSVGGRIRAGVARAADEAALRPGDRAARHDPGRRVPRAGARLLPARLAAARRPQDRARRAGPSRRAAAVRALAAGPAAHDSPPMTRTRWLTAGLCAVLLAAGAPGPGPARGRRPPAGWEAFTRAFDAYMDSNRVVGASALVMRDGRVLARHDRGFADRARHEPAGERTIYHWASITKTLTAGRPVAARGRRRLSLHRQGRARGAAP